MTRPTSMASAPQPRRSAADGARRTVGALAVALATAFTVGCSDLPTAPAASAPHQASLAPSEQPSHALLGTVLGTLQTATSLTRLLPIASLVRTSVVVGPNGGTFSVPLTGLTVTVPKGAVSTNTTITVSVPLGRGVWYEFGPSGTKFAVPLTLTQDLRLTNFLSLGSSAKVEGAYFRDGSLNTLLGTAQVSEVFPVTYNGTRTSLSFKVDHFSGYMVSTGRSDSFSGDE